MGIVSKSFRVQRIALVAGGLTPIRPPAGCQSVNVDNGTAGDLMIHTNDNETEYLVVAAGYGRVIAVEHHLYAQDEIAFWLKAVSSGTAVLLWT